MESGKSGWPAKQHGQLLGEHAAIVNPNPQSLLSLSLFVFPVTPIGHGSSSALQTPTHSSTQSGFVTDGWQSGQQGLLDPSQTCTCLRFSTCFQPIMRNNEHLNVKKHIHVRRWSAAAAAGDLRGRRSWWLMLKSTGTLWLQYSRRRSVES